MSTHRPRRITRDDAEHLLAGGVPAGPRAGGDPLVDLLAAMGTPAQPGELDDEEAALATFRAARLGPVPQPRRPSMLKMMLAKLLTVKVAAAALVATAAVGGGVALASNTGVLPTPFKHDTPTSTAGDRPTSDQAHGTGKPSGAPRSDKDPGASPSPSLPGLCHAYTAGVGDNSGKALENPAFTALITAAAGKEKVAAYCAALLAAQPGGKPTASPGKPTVNPGKPTEDPGNKPTAKPGKGPAAHPTGPPTDRPKN